MMSKVFTVLLVLSQQALAAKHEVPNDIFQVEGYYETQEEIELYAGLADTQCQVSPLKVRKTVDAKAKGGNIVGISIQNEMGESKRIGIVFDKYVENGVVKENTGFSLVCVPRVYARVAPASGSGRGQLQAQ